MPRRRIELSDFYPYHLCARANNKEWFGTSLDQIFDIYAAVLQKTSLVYGFECHSFVLMANHFHMVVSTPRANLSCAMRYFMTESSRAIARSSQRINRIYGARYHWTILRSSEHYAHAFKYVYRNPIAANISKTVETYPWSTVGLYRAKLSKAIVENKNGFTEHIPATKTKLLRWLNFDEGTHYHEHVKRAMAKHVFRFGQDKASGKRPHFSDKLHPKNMPGT